MMLIIMKFFNSSVTVLNKEFIIISINKYCRISCNIIKEYIDDVTTVLYENLIYTVFCFFFRFTVKDSALSATFLKTVSVMMLTDFCFCMFLILILQFKFISYKIIIYSF